ncbi:hypothetical protein [Roseobacter sp. MH60115]|uniref:hypothetical protein n=1 Tax=Roseobacter sp. MH60115 TaxID=2785324 RepID=UPI0018A24E94|nr:hypothetical protein [Roseobacter sp. MH60115]
MDRELASRVLSEILPEAIATYTEERVLKFALDHRPMNRTRRILVPVTLDNQTRARLAGLAEELHAHHVPRPMERVLLATVVNYFLRRYNYDVKSILRRGYIAPEAVNHIVALRRESSAMEEEDSNFASSEFFLKSNPVLSVSKLRPNSELSRAFEKVHKRERLKPLSDKEMMVKWTEIKEEVGELKR